MKTIKLLLFGILTLVAAASYAQTNSSPVIPLQDSSRAPQDKKLNSSPTPMPKTGNPSEDSLIRNQRGESVGPDSSKYIKNSMKKGRKRGGSGEMDTTGTRRKNN